MLDYMYVMHCRRFSSTQKSNVVHCSTTHPSLALEFQMKKRRFTDVAYPAVHKKLLRLAENKGEEVVGQGSRCSKGSL